MPVPESSSIDLIDAVLPQTQCRQCGYDGCLPYAAAIAGGVAQIDQCPPGGDRGVVKIAAVVGHVPVPQNPRYGTQKAKRMHDVVADLCSGCELCLPACPVDCIRMVEPDFTWDEVHAASARQRHRARASRLARLAAEASSKGKPGTNVAASAMVPAPSRKQAIVAAAVERARVMQEKRAGRAAVDDGR